MPISMHFTSIFQKEFDVNFSQITPSGFLKITELCNFFQLTAAEHSELGGISFLDMQCHDQAWVLSKMRIELKKMPRWKDKIAIKTWIISLENSRSLRATTVLLNDEVIVAAETLWVVLNTSKRRPEALSVAHDHFKKFPNDYANFQRISTVSLLKSYKDTTNRKVVFSDLDVVNHVNHIKYLEWCLDMIMPEQILNNKIQAIEMNFMSELLQNDEVTIQTEVFDNKQLFVIQKNEKDCFLLSIDFY